MMSASCQAGESRRAYPGGREGAADVSLTPLLAAEQRLHEKYEAVAEEARLARAAMPDEVLVWRLMPPEVNRVASGCAGTSGPASDP